MQASSLLLFFFVLIYSCQGFASAEPSWVKWAHRTGAAEAQRDEALRQLRKIPKIEAQLISALDGPYRALALDAMGGLQNPAFVEELIKRVAEDPDGFGVLTLNSLINKDNFKKIAESYINVLKNSEKSSPSVLVAVLEPLGRSGVALPEDIVKSLVQHGTPEVRSSIFYYIRLMLLADRGSEYQKFFKTSFEDPIYQLRMQAYFALGELRKKNEKFKVHGIDHKKCESETKGEVKYACLKAFNKNFELKASPLLSGPSNLDVYMVFGYKDTRPGRFVGDRHERLAFVEHVISKCKEDDVVCGFSRSPKDQDLFIRKYSGPKGVYTVRMAIVQSSVHTDDEANRENPMQDTQSAYVKRAFYEGLDRGDVVFYNGHSRFGGGPDFKPPVVDEFGKVNSGFYKAYQPGLTSLTDSLQFRVSQKKRDLKVLGLFSCSSSQHFNDKVKKVSSLRLITSPEMLHYAEALKKSLLSLSETISQDLKASSK